jgi:tetratricopeptide (TPR) repeat protein
MNEAVSLKCNLAIQCRVSMTAGDIVYRKNNMTEAMKLYESAYQSSILSGRGGVEVCDRLGNVYLASGDLIQAETYFNQGVGMEQDFGADTIPYAKYGLARVARENNETDKARQIAQEVLSDLSRTVPSHNLLNEIRNFLKDLENISS